MQGLFRQLSPFKYCNFKQIFKSITFTVAFPAFNYFFYKTIKYCPPNNKAFKIEGRHNGKVALITGASSGIGKSTAIELAKRGVKVIIVCRNQYSGNLVQNEILNECPDAITSIKTVNLVSAKSIMKFCSKIFEEEPNIDILINNAGVRKYGSNKIKTNEGVEIHFGVNYLAHFMLTKHFLEHLSNKKENLKKIRIINVINPEHSKSVINFADIGFNSFYSAKCAYRQAELAKMTHLKKLSQDYSNDKNLQFIAAMPGQTYTRIHQKGTLISTVLNFLLFKQYIFAKPSQSGFLVAYAALNDFSKELGNSLIVTNENVEKCEWTNDDVVPMKKLWLLSKKWTESWFQTNSI